MRNLLKIASINLLILFSALLAIDALTAITLRKSSFKSISPIYHHGFIPGALYDEEWSPGVRIREKINAYGMRQTTSELPSKKILLKDYKSVVIGDSFAEGVGVPYDLTIPSILSSRYGPVANLGVRSHAPTLSEARLGFYRDKGLSPEVIIHIVDSSDIQDEYHYSRVEGFSSCHIPRLCHSLQSFIERCLGRLLSVQWSIRAWWWVQSGRWGNPNPYSWWGGRSSYYQQRDPFLGIKPHYFDDGLKLLTQSLARIHAVNPLSRYVVVVYPPRTIVSSRDVDNSRYKQFIKAIRNLALDRPGMSVCVPEIPLVDGGSRLYIPGDGHWNANGHLVVANHIIQHCI